MSSSHPKKKIYTHTVLPIISRSSAFLKDGIEFRTTCRIPDFMVQIKLLAPAALSYAVILLRAINLRFCYEILFSRFCTSYPGSELGGAKRPCSRVYL